MARPVTSPAEFRTERLTLRPLVAGDAAAVAEGIGHWDVIRWLVSPPWPYRLEDAESFIARHDSDGALAVTEGDGPVLGVVHIAPSGELGYWLRPEAQGRGLMTEAATALVAAHFAGSDSDLVSGHLPGNEASARVLAKLGFRYTAPRRQFHRAEGREVETLRMALSARDWAGRP
ncbi:GNAT family N-acetyltransferase [Frigidibacter sp. ROC022]|uniref:GNAT family N-acetyltransferase n=1 Tax=Frigidibacter sp. ROC022 TaxID=2971796 RepID=UPI00215B3243|nr:GNAT family N-acetyltransferase [Frigidibacter sp. ROC022]MCR8723914.1 GNAT family N-acetyltransferase [Frigidibacter sp. ROC022]